MILSDKQNELIADKNAEIPGERQENKDFIEHALRKLNKQEKTVIKLYYYRGYNLEEVSMSLRLTESRISQIRTSAIKKMRKWAKGELECH